MALPAGHACLNSCSGEPAARGTTRRDRPSKMLLDRLNSCSGEPAARGHHEPHGPLVRRRVSIPVLVNLRLGGGVRPEHLITHTWGLNSCSGEPAARGSPARPTACWRRFTSLNSCSGEPAARGRRRDPHRPALHAAVSIPVLVSLRLGAKQFANPTFTRVWGSQFLFW